MAYIKTVPHSEATGDLKVAYDAMAADRGFVANVHAVSGLRPHIMKSFSDHSGAVMRTASGLTPAEKEMIASVVSAVNKCVY